MRAHWISLIFLGLLVVGGCATSQSSEENFASQSPQNPLTQEPLEYTPENPVQINSTLEINNMSTNPPPVEKFVALSKKDLSDRLNVPIENVSLYQTTEMLWPNSALGCPSPGKVYPQGRVPGYKIWLESGGIQYIYHTDYDGQIVLCPTQNEDLIDPSNAVPGSTQDPNIGVPIR